MRTRLDARPRIVSSIARAPSVRPRPVAYHPRSKSELLADARQAARLARGRTVFVQRARVLPIGLPLGAAAAALRYHQRRERGDPVGEAVAAAGLVLLATVAVTTGAAHVEWALRRRAYRHRHV